MQVGPSEGKRPGGRTRGEGQDFGAQIDYSFEGTALLGNAGAVKNGLARVDDSTVGPPGGQSATLEQYVVVAAPQAAFEEVAGAPDDKAVQIP